MAKQYFTDYMKWLYTAMRLTKMNQKLITPILPFILTFVWQEYVQLSYDFFTMSDTLFKVKYVHKTDIEVNRDNLSEDHSLLLLNLFKHDVAALKDDWGNDYVNRVFTYEIEAVKIYLEINE